MKLNSNKERKKEKKEMEYKQQIQNKHEKKLKYNKLNNCRQLILENM